MTGDERMEILRAIDNLSAKVEAQAEHRVEVIGEIAGLGGKIETLTAVVEAHQDKTSGEIQALFTKATTAAEKIQGILVDYVPKGACAALHEKVQDDHAADISRLEGQQKITTVKVEGLTWRVALIAGGISVIVFLVDLAVRGYGAMAK